MRKVFILTFMVLLLIGIVYALEQPNQFTYDSNGKRDPFMPLVDSKGNLLNVRSFQATSSDFYLQGIVYGAKDERYAVINSEIVREGDAISDYKVIKIEKDKVVLLRGTEERILELENKQEEKNETNKK